MSEDYACKIVKPGDVVGVLGGGQLGRMLAIAAAQLGLKTHVYAPERDTPAFDVAFAKTSASFDDLEALTKFAKACDVVTIEFENVPTTALKLVSAYAPTRPNTVALEATQDRLNEKIFLRSVVEAHTVDFYAVNTLDDLIQGLTAEGGRGVLKTRRFGYDGKGQAVISSANEAKAAWEALAPAQMILEAIAPFEREISVIVARSVDGKTVCYDPAENSHENGILRTSVVPPSVLPKIAAQAQRIAMCIVESLDYVGTMGVELFVLPDGRLLVNELAPRVHNSGHWTQDACVVDQFEQHIRAVCGWPLGSTTRHSNAAMTNIIGDEMHQWRDFVGEPNTATRLYGKAEARPGRKMGHVTQLTRYDTPPE